MRILGIDPGSRITGYGIVDQQKDTYRHVASGAIKLSSDALPIRLRQIFREVGQLVEQWQPEVFVIENVFVHKNAASALKLGQARGAAICAAVNCDLEVFEYTPKEIKQAVVGKGGATKGQVQMMVRVLLNLQQFPQADEADALACAICHGNRAHILQQINQSTSSKMLGAATGWRGGRFR